MNLPGCGATQSISHDGSHATVVVGRHRENDVDAV
jgi:hypothetical protein